jgi:hypothetical protein
MTTYHKKRHPWRNQDLRSDDKRAAGPRIVAPECPESYRFSAGTGKHVYVSDGLCLYCHKAAP